jgi:hypothetical protein
MTDMQNVVFGLRVATSLMALFIGSWLVTSCTHNDHIRKIEQHLERIAENQK